MCTRKFNHPFYGVSSLAIVCKRYAVFDLEGNANAANEIWLRCVFGTKEVCHIIKVSSLKKELVNPFIDAKFGNLA